MKKIASILLLLIVAFSSSCTEDLSKNNPSFQAWRDDALWRSNQSWAEVTDNGAVRIVGLTAYETVELMTPSINSQGYPLGNSISRRAYYTYARDGVEDIYSTGSSFGEGMIVIEEYDEINQTLTGRFRFNAEMLPAHEGNPIVNFRDGIFYKIPVIPAP